MTDDLVKRLRDLAGFLNPHGDLTVIPDTINEAADRIEALTAENERLREVLGFYADWGIVGPHYDDQVHLDSGDLARAALGDTQ